MWRYIKNNRGKILGGLGGFLLALILIIAWPVILMVFLIFLGIMLGAAFDTIGKARRWLEESLDGKRHDKES